MNLLKLKPGFNNGKPFYCCGETFPQKKCKFFQWEIPGTSSKIILRLYIELDTSSHNNEEIQIQDFSR